MGICTSSLGVIDAPPQPRPLSESANNPVSNSQSVKTLPTANAKPQSVQQTANDACVAALSCNVSGSFGCFSTHPEAVRKGFTALSKVAKVYMLNEKVRNTDIKVLKNSLNQNISNQPHLEWITDIQPKHIIDFLDANKNVSIKIYIESLPDSTVEHGAFCSSAISYQLLQSTVKDDKAKQSMFPVTFIDGQYSHGVIELSKPAKIQYTDKLYSTSRILFSISDYCQGGSVYNTTQSFEAFQTVLDSLRELHKSYIIHGDIKPENIVLCGNQTKLIDLDSLFIANDLGDLFGMTYTPAFQSPVFEAIIDLFSYAKPRTLIKVSMVSHFFKVKDEQGRRTDSTYNCVSNLLSTLKTLSNLSRRSTPTNTHINVIDLISYVEKAEHQGIPLVKWISLKHDEYALGLTLKEVCNIDKEEDKKIVDALLNLDSLWFNPKQSIEAPQGGKPKTTIRYMDKAYKVRLSKDNAKKYIMVKRQRVYLSDIRGKYRYVQS